MLIGENLLLYFHSKTIFLFFKDHGSLSHKVKHFLGEEEVSLAAGIELVIWLACVWEMLYSRDNGMGFLCL